MKPGTIDASLPPATAMSTIPERTMWNAWPIAWLAEAQALPMQKHGPWMPNSMETWLAGALGMIRGTVKGCTRGRRRP